MIDPSLFPTLSTRLALLIVDAQNDFLASDGALPVAQPERLPEQIVELVRSFRPHGDVIWIGSEFQQPRPVSGGQHVTSGEPVSESSSPLAEAFLSQPDGDGGLPCVRPGTEGAALHPTIEAAVDRKQDAVLTKSDYSAFQLEALVQRLRMRFVTELLVCGSLSNVGVQNTVLDAASHSFELVVVEDCCGRRDALRHEAALQRMQDVAGCVVGDVKSVQRALQQYAEKQSSASIAQLVGCETQAQRSAKSDSDGSTKSEYATKTTTNTSDPTTANISVPDLDYTFAALSLDGLKARAEASVPLIQSFLLKQQHERKSRPSFPAARLSQAKSRTGGQFAPDDDLYADSDEDANTTEDDSNCEDQEPPSGRQVPPSLPTQPKSAENIVPTSGLDASHLSLDLGSTRKDQSPAEATVGYSSADQGDKGSPQVIIKDSGTTMNVNDDLATESSSFCEGDTKIIYDVLPEPLVNDIFDRVQEEVEWARMSHQGGEVPRLVAVQGDLDEDGSFPIYRHPADESPPLFLWTPAVRAIREVAEARVGHPLNHALIQLYRDGNDFISEHSDKTLDIAPGSFIVNVSLGAERTMVLRTKRSPRDRDTTSPPSQTPHINGPKRDVQRARLPHSSMCQMGLATNMRWLHAIRADKRMERDKTPAELAFNGSRISLTFRKIGTFLDAEKRHIWGQGAVAKTKEAARPVVNGGDGTEAVRMVQAFGRENQVSEFDWQEAYGAGFDVLHITPSKRLFLSGDEIVDARVQIMLAEYDIRYARGSLTTPTVAGPSDVNIGFVDNDTDKSTVEGELAIMLYLKQVYGQPQVHQPTLAKEMTRMQAALALGVRWTALRLNSDAALITKQLKRDLSRWNAWAREAKFIAGEEVGLADFALWPVLMQICKANASGSPNRNEEGMWGELGLEALGAYYRIFGEREAAKEVKERVRLKGN